jgi:hypothetical protein
LAKNGAQAQLRVLAAGKAIFDKSGITVARLTRRHHGLQRRVLQDLLFMNLSAAAIAGSARARDIGVLRAAIHGASKSDNTWEIMRLYDENPNGSSTSRRTGKHTHKLAMALPQTL